MMVSICQMVVANEECSEGPSYLGNIELQNEQ